MRLKNVSIRLDGEDLDRLDRLAARFGGIVTPSALARAAIRLGLARLEAEGISILESAPSKQGKRQR